VYRETVQHSESRGRLCKAAVPRHREHHLQPSCTDKPCCWSHLSNKPTLVTTCIVDSLHHTPLSSSAILPGTSEGLGSNLGKRIFQGGSYFLLHRTLEGLQPLRIKLNTKFFTEDFPLYLMSYKINSLFIL
jgi:hypothetical protein